MPNVPAVIQLGSDERVWVTGDVHLAPDDSQRATFFLAFLKEAQRSADRLVLLGDLFDYWIGPRHGRACAYRQVIEALEEAASTGFPLDFVAGNRDFLGPGELRALGLRVHGDAVVFDRDGKRTVVTHGDLLVEGDLSYKRYRWWVRSWWFHFTYRLVPVWVRLWVAGLLRGASERKLTKLEPYAFPIDLARSQEWQTRHKAKELLMGHLHRDETHEHGECTTRMLPPWGPGQGPHFVLGPTSELKIFSG
jgi:UDP-2,3-diacylglucosamine hydrolase